ncbi:MAG: radical SAM protein [Ruminococcaceae bacterium]|nr:radical SAM protein [Oscillospiraceae bacterium]
MKEKKHINIPIFIPHLGCPNDCAFCNQRSISGRTHFDISDVRRQIEDALSTAGERESEIAFFGGSFTGIDRALMVSLLEIAEEYVRAGKVGSIRLSTRPDYINEEILDILGRYSVKTIELGIQSASDKVLEASKRGHTLSDTVKACKLIKERGFDLVGQMMIGLPMSDGDSEIETAKLICELGASEARIYPIVILKNTHLTKMVESGEYIPLAESELVGRSASVLEVFRNNGVKVLRIGLHSGTELNSGEEIACGYYHPAMGELVEGELYYRELEKCIAALDSPKKITVTVPRGELSKAIGQNGRNRRRLTEKLGLISIKFKEGEALSISEK